MRVALVREVDGPVEVSNDAEAVGPGPGEVRVRIAATGVCHSDVSVQNGTLAHPVPCVLGHEGAGEVISVGEGVQRVKPGDHVIVAWMPPCGACRHCYGGQANLCQNVLMTKGFMPRFLVDGAPTLGFSGTGTFAEEVVIAEEAAVVIPDDVPFDVASLVGCGVMTGVGAVINTAKVEPGASVCVIGCGGVGISVIQGARLAGAAEIVAVDLVDRKLEWAQQFGATTTVTPDGLERVRPADGFDYAFEVIGLPKTIERAYEVTRRGGTMVVVGAGRADAMVQFSAFDLFYTERTIKGCLYGSADVRTDFLRLINLWKAGKLDLEGMITRRLDLKEVGEAFAAMQRGEVIRSVIEF